MRPYPYDREVGGREGRTGAREAKDDILTHGDVNGPHPARIIKAMRGMGPVRTEEGTRTRGEERRDETSEGPHPTRTDDDDQATDAPEEEALPVARVHDLVHHGEALLPAVGRLVGPSSID